MANWEAREVMNGWSYLGFAGAYALATAVGLICDLSGLLRSFSSFTILFVCLYCFVSAFVLPFIWRAVRKCKNKLSCALFILLAPYLSAVIAYLLMLSGVSWWQGERIAKHGMLSIVLVGLFFPYLAIKGPAISAIFLILSLLLQTVNAGTGSGLVKQHSTTKETLNK
jgi:hypothetical protein